jgi:ABC-type glycerol-3-phosphate transport system permease component
MTGARVQKADMAVFFVLALGAFLMVAPFLWMLSTSLKPPADQLDGRFYPLHPTVVNYFEIFKIAPLHLQLWNSLKIAAISTLGQLISCSMAGFIFAVVRFPGRNFLFILLLATLMVPGQITTIPQFIIFKYLGLYGTQMPLYLPSFLGGAFGVFLMRQYFSSIPIELAEAARIEGASLGRIFLSVYMPLAKPALAAFAIFAFLFSWNDLFSALVYLPAQPENTTLPVGLNMMFSQQYLGHWTLTMAASLMSVAPIIVVFLLAQRHFIQGIAMSGFK